MFWTGECKQIFLESELVYFGTWLVMYTFLKIKWLKKMQTHFQAFLEIYKTALCCTTIASSSSVLGVCKKTNLRGFYSGILDLKNIISWYFRILKLVQHLDLGTFFETPNFFSSIISRIDLEYMGLELRSPREISTTSHMQTIPL